LFIWKIHPLIYFVKNKLKPLKKLLIIHQYQKDLNQINQLEIIPFEQKQVQILKKYFLSNLHYIGNHPSAGSTTPIHLQLIDINDKKSKDIRLKKKDNEGHHFAPGSIDEFKLTLSESLSTLKFIKLSLDAEKYQGWYGEWISITDDDNQLTYCFPIQRWLDKGEADRKTHVTLYQQSNIPCHQIPDSLRILSNQDNEPVGPLLSARRDENYEFEIRTQTADKSLKGKSGRDANVYLNIYDKNNKQIGDAIRLENSQNHKKSFQRHHTDQFHLIIPNTRLSDIDRIDLYHDGQNDG
jgi:hypothetical protein